MIANMFHFGSDAAASLCSYYSVILGKVPPTARSDWLLMAVCTTVPQTTWRTSEELCSEDKAAHIAEVAMNILIVYAEVLKTSKSYDLFL